MVRFDDQEDPARSLVPSGGVDLGGGPRSWAHLSPLKILRANIATSDGSLYFPASSSSWIAVCVEVHIIRRGELLASQMVGDRGPTAIQHLTRLDLAAHRTQRGRQS
jgi:hypothetical protein